MFARLFKPPSRMRADLQDEILSLCRNGQIERLSVPPGLQRDLAVDCGCAARTQDTVRRIW